MKGSCCGGIRGPISADLGLLVLRLVAGLSLAMHGYAKLHEHKDMFWSGIYSMGKPISLAPGFFGWAAIAAELGGIALAIGLFTRLSAFLILCVMGVAVFKVHAKDAYQVKELAAVYGAVAIAFLLAGPGRISLDALLFARKKEPAEPQEKVERFG
jgi:putative oxidoreductase